MTSLTNNEIHLQNARIVAAKLGLAAGMVVTRDRNDGIAQVGIVVVGAAPDGVSPMIRTADGLMWAAAHDGKNLGWIGISIERQGAGVFEAAMIEARRCTGCTEVHQIG